MKMMYKNNIHSLELPEFGLSFSITEEIKNVNIIDKICDFIYLYITHIIWKNNKKTKIILVGHSWAGFFAVHFLYKYPEFIEKLVLIDPCGIIEDLSEKTNKITLFMKKYFTYSSFLYLKHLYFDFFCILCVRLFFWKKEHIAKRIFYTYYIILLLSHIENNKSHFLIDSCIEMNKTNKTNKNLYFWCKPTKYLISQMIDAKKKIYFIYGENDDITPMDKIIKLFASKAPFYIIPNAKHTPYADNPEVFCHILSEICIL